MTPLEEFDSKPNEQSNKMEIEEDLKGRFLALPLEIYQILRWQNIDSNKLKNTGGSKLNCKEVMST